MAKKCILIADDERPLRQVLVGALKNEDCRIFQASNGKQAVEIAEKNPIDLAILDIVMPEMDGIEAMKRIKALDNTIEVLVITGHAKTDSLRETIFGLGAFDYLLKPFNFTELKLVVQKALGNRDMLLRNSLLKKELENQILELKRDFKEKTFELRHSQIKYRNIVENSTDSIVVTQDRYSKFANSKALELTGYSKEEILKIPFEEMIHPDDRPETMERYRNRLKGEDVPPMSTFRVMRKDGSFFWVENNASKTFWGEDPAVLNVMRDISKSMKIEETVKIKDAALATSISGIAFADLDGNTTYVNKAFLKMWGYSDEGEVLGKPSQSFLRNKTESVKAIKAVRKRGGLTREATAVRKDGSLFDVQISSNMVTDESNKPICIMISLLDITEQKRAKEYMLRSEKLSSLGQLSAGLSHELRNPLTVISSCSQFCLENMKLERLMRENFQVIYRSSRRASKLIDGLLAFARPGQLKWTEVDINEMLINVLHMTKFEVNPSHISLVRYLKKGLPKIMGDKEKMEQVFLNLIQNAIHAISGKGKVTLKSELLAADDMLEISVSDNGPGIPEDYHKKIFDPFFTTKDGGTGLGLSICNSIVEQHRGSINITSGEGVGTRISVRLPLKQELREGV